MSHIRLGPRSGVRMSLAFYERKLATAFIGVLTMVWSLIPYIGSGADTLFTKFIREETRGDTWFAIMFITGLMQLIGGICPRRSLRHHALMMGAFVWGATWLMFMSRAFITPVTMTLGLFSAFCVVLLIQDTRMKPREQADE